MLGGRALGARDLGKDGFEVSLTGGNTLRAGRVLVATGLTDELPDLDGLAEHWGRGVIHCPFCHGFEIRDQRVVQVVTHPMGLHPAPVLAHLTDQLTVVLHGGVEVDEDALGALARAGVSVERAEVSRVVSGEGGELAAVVLGDGRELAADVVVVGPRFRARVDALSGLGLSATAHVSGAGEVLEVDPRGQTAAPGVFAAGNVTDPMLQVLTAAAQGSQVAVAIAFSLAEEDLRAPERRGGNEADWDRRYADEDHTWSGNPNGTLVAELDGMTPGRALDVGAGEGADALWLAEHGWQVSAGDQCALGRSGALVYGKVPTGRASMSGAVPSFRAAPSDGA